MDLLLVIAIFGTFYLAGEALARRWQPVYSDITERLVFHTLLGLVAVAVVTTGLAFAGGIYPATGWIVLGAIVLGSYKTFPELRTELSNLRPILGTMFGGGSGNRGFQGFNLLVLAGLAVLALILALAPPVKTDALVYHLAIPQAYLEHHGITPLPNNMYSFFPMLFDMVFLFAMTFGVESLPALCGLGMTLLLLAGMTVYCRNYFSPRLAWFVPVLYFSTPTFFEISASAYIDVALAGFVFFAFYSWDRWRDTGRSFWFFYLTLFAGAAWSTKLTGLILIPLAVLGITLAGRQVKNPLWVLKHIAVFFVIVFLFMTPWWLRNYQFFGNPFLPLLMPLFGGEDLANWDPQRMAMFDHYVRRFGMGRGFMDLLLLPYNLTFEAKPNSYNFDGQIGILFFMLIPAVIVGLWKSRSPRLVSLAVFSAVLIFFWFIYFQYVRFLAPAFTGLALISVAGLEEITRRNPETSKPSPWWGRTVLCVAACGVLFNLSLVWDLWQKKAPWKYVSGRETRDEYLARNVPPYPMYQALNELDPEAKVFLVYMRNLGYLAPRSFYSDSVFEAHTLQKIMERDASPEGIRRQFQSLGITYIMFDRNFVFGEIAALPPAHQKALVEFLKIRGKLLKQMKDYFLYELVLD